MKLVWWGSCGWKLLDVRKEVEDSTKCEDRKPRGEKDGELVWCRSCWYQLLDARKSDCRGSALQLVSVKWLPRELDRMKQLTSLQRGVF